MPVPIAANAPDERKTYPDKPMIGSNSVSWLNAIEHHDPYPLRAVITSNNPMMAWPNQDRVRAAFKQLDLMVHIDLFMNETSHFADYVLPAQPVLKRVKSAEPLKTGALSGSINHCRHRVMQNRMIGFGSSLARDSDMMTC